MDLKIIHHQVHRYSSLPCEKIKAWHNKIILYLSNGEKMMTHAKNKKGFTLVEVMVAIGLMGGLGVIVMSLTKNARFSTAKFTFDSDTISTVNEISAILMTPESCLATVTKGTCKGNASPGPAQTFNNVFASDPNCLKPSIPWTSDNNPLTSPANPTFVIYKNSAGDYMNKYYVSSDSNAPAGGYGNSGIKIKQYELKLTNPSQNEAEFWVTFEKKNILIGASGADTVLKKINLYAEFDNSNPPKMLKCRALAGGSSDIWLRSPTNSNQVSYSGEAIASAGISGGKNDVDGSCSTEGAMSYNTAKGSLVCLSDGATPPANKWYSYCEKVLGGTYDATKNPPCSLAVFLVNSVHTDKQCESANGSVYTDSSGGKKFCRFSVGTCPTSWTPYQNWTSTSAQTISTTYCGGASTSCTTGEHLSFMNIPVEVCYYQSGGKDGLGRCNSGNAPCYARTTEIGCY